MIAMETSNLVVIASNLRRVLLFKCGPCLLPIQTKLTYNTYSGLRDGMDRAVRAAPQDFTWAYGPCGIQKNSSDIP